MKESKLVKIVLIMILSLIVILAFNTKQSLAANNITITDLTNSIGNNTTTNNTTVNNTTVNNTTNNTVLTTNNTSNYNNSSLPKTGIEDSISGIVLVVILGISAVYAYNKIQYYKNI